MLKVNVQDETRKALRSLPWYLIGGWLLLPLPLAFFTAGASLLLYALPFGILNPGEFWVAILSFAGPGLALWIPRQFLRAAVFSWKRNHLVSPLRTRNGQAYSAGWYPGD